MARVEHRSTVWFAPPPPSGRIVRQAAKCDHSSVGGKLGKETSRFPWYCHCLVKRSTRSVSAPVIGEDRWGQTRQTYPAFGLKGFSVSVPQVHVLILSRPRLVGCHTFTLVLKVSKIVTISHVNKLSVCSHFF